MMNVTTVFWRWLMIAICAGPMSAYAAAAQDSKALQPLDSIIDVATQATRAKAVQQGYEGVEVNAKPLDSRLRLPLCDLPLEALDSRSTAVLGPVSLGVRCSGSTPWTLYVRMDITATKAVPVLARSMTRGTRIATTDLRFMTRPIDSVPNGILFNADHIVGMELNRALNEGSTIRASQLQAPKVVKRGDQVTVLSGAGGLTVRIQGKALGDASAGERVSVVNSVTGVKVEGIAGTDGTVTVP